MEIEYKRIKSKSVLSKRRDERIKGNWEVAERERKKSLYKCGDREPKKRICFKKTMNSQ